mmetsp:Transcript_91879/g.231872  ORF Transcript_91879/g.231872 Transcript_91879/m.231872 type:complete len:237 (+) Transcript_91879:310-1020(+)
MARTAEARTAGQASERPRRITASWKRCSSPERLPQSVPMATMNPFRACHIGLLLMSSQMANLSVFDAVRADTATMASSTSTSAYATLLAARTAAMMTSSSLSCSSNICSSLAASELSMEATSPSASQAAVRTGASGSRRYLMTTFEASAASASPRGATPARPRSKASRAKVPSARAAANHETATTRRAAVFRKTRMQSSSVRLWSWSWPRYSFAKLNFLDGERLIMSSLNFCDGVL